jgi:hypothetical protein
MGTGAGTSARRKSRSIFGPENLSALTGSTATRSANRLTHTAAHHGGQLGALLGGHGVINPAAVKSYGASVALTGLGFRGQPLEQHLGSSRLGDAL